MSVFLIGIAAALVLAAAPAAVQAQTAHFSYAERTLVGSFSAPSGVAIDGSGNVYVADYGDSAVKKIPSGCTSSSCVTVLGGGFRYPQGVAVDASGFVYVADSGNNAVKRMPSDCTQSSCVTTLNDDLDFPTSVAVNARGDLYVTQPGPNDQNKAQVVEMPPGCGSTGCITALGGGFQSASGLAVDGSGNVYVADNFARAVKKIPSGCTSSSCVTALGGGFNFPEGVAVDGSGNVYVADTYANAVKQVPPGCVSSSCVTTLGGSFNQPKDVAVDGGGNVYVADTSNNAVKEIMNHGVKFYSVPLGSTVGAVQLTFTFDSAGTIGAPKVLTEGAAGLDFADAGTGSCTANGTDHSYSAGDTCTVDVTFTPKFAALRRGVVELVNSSGAVIATAYDYGTGLGPQIVFGPSRQGGLGGGFTQINDAPMGVAVDGGGNVYVVEQHSSQVNKIPFGCGSSSCVTTLGGGLNWLTAVAVDGGGNVYVGDYYEHRVTLISPECTSLSCVVTLGGGFSGPIGVAVDGSGNVYVADTKNNSVKEMPPGCVSSSCVTKLGGGFKGPQGVAVDGSGNVYVAEFGNSAVKEMPPGCASSSCVTELGTGGFSEPQGVAVDSAGNVYVADYADNPDVPARGHAVKEMPPGCVSASCVTTLAGNFSDPSGVALDGAGNLYVSDLFKGVQETYRATPPSLTFAATPVGSESSDSPQTVTVANIGNAPLTFPVPETGNNPSISTSFALGSATTCPQVSASSSAEGTLNVGASCDLSIEFVPQAAGAIIGTVTLTDSALPATQTIPLSGTGKQQVGATNWYFSLTNTGAASQTVQPGAAATYTLQLAPSSSDYPDTVTFSASGLPTGATAVFSPATLASNAGKQSVTLTVQTASSSAKTSNPFALAAPLALALVLLPALGLRRVRRGLLLVLIAAAGFCGLAALSGCGSSTQPPPANYTITVTATSGQLTSSVKVQLEVQ
jgi:large repetitive protein